jgi:phosphoglycolate phosphatase-like HAD superfamily hydrolase
MADIGVIFDVDGVLLELTSAEEDIFFQAFGELYGITGLSRDWDSYKIRNDEKIVEEILARHGLPLADVARFRAHYLDLLKTGLTSGRLSSIPITGAVDLLARLNIHAKLGVATANFLGAAKLRLQYAGVWDVIASHAFGADGSGHKRETVARAIASMNLPRERIVYVGDNLNDLDAAEANGVAFIAFSTDEGRRQKLRRAGARHLSPNHAQTLTFLKDFLYLDKAAKL